MRNDNNVTFSYQKWLRGRITTLQCLHVAYLFLLATRWRSRLRHCATSRKVAGSIPRWCHWSFLLTWSFRPHYGPGVDSACNRNEYQEYFLGVKAAGAQGWQPYHLHVPIVLKSGSLKLLEPSGPVQACAGDCFSLSRSLHLLHRFFSTSFVSKFQIWEHEIQLGRDTSCQVDVAPPENCFWQQSCIRTDKTIVHFISSSYRGLAN